VTHIDIEVTVVDINPICGLLEVEMSNTVPADIGVGKAER
jgi:hypothetical protein